MKNERKVEFLELLSPEYIYIKYDKKENLKLKRNKLVLRNLFLGIRGKNTNIFSPVSGKIIGIKNIETLDGVSEALVVENDYREKRVSINGKRSNINKISNKDFKELMSLYNLDIDFNNKKKLEITTTFNRKNDLNDSFIIGHFYHEIIDLIDEVMMMFDIPHTNIILSKVDKYSYKYLDRYIASFLNMEVRNKQVSGSSITISLYDLIRLRDALYFNYYKDTKYITVVYNKNKISVVNIKIGVCLHELLSFMKISTINLKIMVNGKEAFNIKEFIIDESVTTISLNNK